MTVKTKLAVVTALALSTSAFAAQEYRQHGAHVHGVVEFNIAQDGHDLLVEITAPGADVVGFEHAPTNSKEEKAIEAATALLKQNDKIITLSSAAECKIEATHVSNTLTGDDHDGHDHHDDHEGHDHDHDHHDDHKGHEHDHDHHDDHKGHDHDHDHHDDHKGHDHDHDHHDDHKGHDHDHDHGGHGEFTIEYHFHCEQLDKLNSIDTQWFTHFSSTEAIDVNLLTDKAQSATKLTENSTRISL